MFSNMAPKQGCLLLAEPFMTDNVFERAVVLLCEHDDQGTLGLVVNKKSQLYLSDILKEPGSEKFPIFVGGPVEPGVLFFIHRAFTKLDSGTPITQDVYWGGDFEKLLFLIAENLINPNEVKFFLGYSGWSPLQLKHELSQNSWGVHNHFDSDLVFLADGEDLWKKAIISLGVKYAHVANFPKIPNLN